MTYYPQNHAKQHYTFRQRHRPPKAIQHLRNHRHHYHFIALCVILGALSAIALTLSQH